MRALLLIAATALALPTHAQWTLQTTPTTADLRGIANAGNGIAWASGTEGTVLRTTDTGKTWHRCTTPPNAEHLDFRGIQAFDANTAVVMSSGKGDLSRLYKTTDGCHTWKLVFTNPDKDGFWDAIQFHGKDLGVLLGDPVEGHFVIYLTFDLGLHWALDEMLVKSQDGEAVFAASNSALIVGEHGKRSFCTGGASGSRIVHHHTGIEDTDNKNVVRDPKTGWATSLWFEQLSKSPVTTASTGCFSIAEYNGARVAVGGDYVHPNARAFTAWDTVPTGVPSLSLRQATTPPHGYRSSVAYDTTTKTWITVGPNGTDISADDGRNWHPLEPSPTDTPDADRNWNSLSLPFVVGPHGRIGILTPTVLASPAKNPE